MFFCHSPQGILHTILPVAWPKPSRGLWIHMLFWCLYLMAFVTFMLSCVLSTLGARSSVRFWSALCAVLATTSVQKLSVLQLVLNLFHREHSICAIVVEFLLSNWTDSILAMVAAWTGQGKIIPAFLVGAITINHLLLIGVCFVNGGHHTSKISYPSLMASIHIRLLPVALALVLCAAFTNVWLGASGKHELRVYSIIALALLIIFTCHIIHICKLNSSVVQTADQLLKLSDCHNRNPRESSKSQKIDTAEASRLQRERRKWVGQLQAMPETARSDYDQCQSWDSVRVVVLLLLSCGASFGSCVQLLGSLASDETGSLHSSLHVGYIFFPISTCTAGIVAVLLHGGWRRSGLGFDSILCGAVLSTFQLICFVLPAFVLVRWAAVSMQSIEFPDEYQVGLLAVAVLVPVYVIQTGGDDWLAGLTMILLCVVYIACVW